MSIDVRELQPGDRVVLNCPKARNNTKREARFDGIFSSIEEAMRDPSGDFPAQVLMQRNTEKFLASGGQWARFLLQTAPPGTERVFTTPGGDALKMPYFPGTTELYAAFIIETDGALREEDGRRIFIERRVHVGRG